MAPHVVATLVATLVSILREVHYKGYIREVFEPMHKYKIKTFRILF